MESNQVREDELKSVAMLPRLGDGLGQGVVLLAESAAQAWESFALIALTSAGVCDRTLRPELGRGAVPCPTDCSASILPGLLLLDWPVKCSLYAGAIDIFRAAPPSAATASCRLP